MRNKQRSEKTYISEDHGVMNQAACMNRIFRKVNENGLTPDILKELGDDIDYISGLYSLGPESVVLLAAILEWSIGGISNDAGLAMYLGCTNIEFIRYRENLREMEKAGILIATTNLLANLDPAFERRFIYKVQFDMPGKESRTQIWKSAIPGLSGKDAAVLACKYAFSGGNIENITSKITVEYILSGSEPSLSSLEKICEAELLNRKTACTKIGF